MKTKFGTIRYRDHTGIILEDGESIKCDKTKKIYENSLFWVHEIDTREGRDPPKLNIPKLFDNYHYPVQLTADEIKRSREKAKAKQNNNNKKSMDPKEKESKVNLILDATGNDWMLPFDPEEEEIFKMDFELDGR